TSSLPVEASLIMSTDDTSLRQSLNASSSPTRSRASMACFMCQKRKIKCDGEAPCSNCRRRHWSCRFNAAADGRRTAANRQAMMQEITDTVAQVRHHRGLLAGIFAIIRKGGEGGTDNLVNLIKTTEDLTQIASYVRDEVDADATVQQAYHAIDWQEVEL
ncbi:hypothetical protein A1O1_09240, partial [Capronia coronata CBS 617.96]